MKLNLSRVKKIAIFSHIRPDGDTIGGMLALCLSLRLAGYQVDMFCDNGVPPCYTALEGFNGINTAPYSEYDMLIAIDCADVARLGKWSRKFSAHSNTVNIDHHFTNERYAKINIVESASSCCEIIYQILKDQNLPVNKAIAESIYVGIITDTGNFAQSNTTKNSFIVSAELTDYQIDLEFLADVFNNVKTYPRMLLVADAIKNMRFFEGGKICLIPVRADDLKRHSLTIQDTEGLIKYAIHCEGVQIGICLTESTKDNYKVSLRSKRPIDASAVARRFGGGGHKQAAGCILSGALEEVIEKLAYTASLELI